MAIKGQSRIQPPKGTTDVFDESLKMIEFVESLAFRIARSYGYSRIQTPTFEHFEVFEQTTETSTEKCFIFPDKSGRQLILRPDLNAPVCRAVLNNLSQEALPIRLFNSQQVFRYRHGANRREFKMFGLEVFGEASPSVDAEVVQVVADICNELNFGALSVDVSNVAIFKSIFNALKKEGKCDAPDVILHRLQLCNNREEQSEYLGALSLPKSTSELLNSLLSSADDPCRQWSVFSDLTQVYKPLDAEFSRTDIFVKSLDACGVDSVNLRLDNVRGAGFYSGLAFRVNVDNGKHEIADGGRYDDFISRLGGTAMPGTGLGLGVERLIRLLAANGKNLGSYFPRVSKVGLCINGLGALKALASSLKSARQRGLEVEMLSGATKRIQLIKCARRKKCDIMILIDVNDSCVESFEVSSFYLSADNEPSTVTVLGTHELVIVFDAIIRGL